MRVVIPAGSVFGRLTVLGCAPEKYQYRVLCSCGTEKIIRSSALREGGTQSCGCLRDSLLKSRHQKASLVGQRFGSLVVQAEVQTELGPMQECLCDCGETTAAFRFALTRGHRKSCGCVRPRSYSKPETNPPVVSKPKATLEPQYARHPLYRTWASMLYRVSPENKQQKSNYYDRGIKVCQRWQDSFAAFASDMGDKPEGLTLDRKDNDGDYCPENCRWATVVEQARNKHRGGLPKGVGKLPGVDQWTAIITLPTGIDLNGVEVKRRRKLGTFPTYGEAVAARLAAEKLYWK